MKTSYLILSFFFIFGTSNSRAIPPQAFKSLYSKFLKTTINKPKPIPRNIVPRNIEKNVFSLNGDHNNRTTQINEFLLGQHGNPHKIYPNLSKQDQYFVYKQLKQWSDKYNQDVAQFGPSRTNPEIKTTSTLNLLPKDMAEYKKVYGKGAIGRQLVSVNMEGYKGNGTNRRFNELYKDLVAGKHLISEKNQTGRQVILQRIKNLKSKEALWIVGHSVAGDNSKRLLCLPNGQKVSTSIIRNFAKSKNKNVFIISCNEAPEGINRQITASEAWKLVSTTDQQTIVQTVGANLPSPPVTVSKIQDTLKFNINNLPSSANKKINKEAIIVIGGGIVWAVVDDE